MNNHTVKTKKPAIYLESYKKFDILWQCPNQRLQTRNTNNKCTVMNTDSECTERNVNWNCTVMKTNYKCNYEGTTDVL